MMKAVFVPFFWALLRIKGRHTDENLVDRVSEIVHKYGFEDRISYFVTDNVESNDTYLEHLSSELGFNKKHRRVRYCRYIINLVA